MKKYTIKLANKNGEMSQDSMHANDENELRMLAKMQGMELVEIMDEQDLTFENVANVKLDENLLDENGKLKPMTIEQQAMAELAAETNPELAAQLPPEMRPMQRDSQGNLISPPPPQVTVASKKEKATFYTDKTTGIEFKFVGDTVYRKDWIEADTDDFKIIRKKSSRQIPNEEIIVFKHDWIEIEEESGDEDE